MGLCSAKLTEEERVEMSRSKGIEKNLDKSKEEEAQKIKLLLLGAGESGKSTVFKQMRILYSKGYSEDELRSFIPIIHGNVMSSIKTLITNAKALSHEFEAANQATAEEVVNLSDDTPLTPELGQKIKVLWEDTGIKAAYADRAKFQLNDSTAYFIGEVDRVTAPGYMPNDQDMLRARVRTSGIVEERYVIDGVEFVMFDVGGQRNERKKWIHCFDSVTAVIFVAAISEYDQVLYEDQTQNRLDEAFQLFDEIANSRWFTSTSMILFLNKRDLFEAKIKKVDIRAEPSAENPEGRFLDYDGGMCVCGGGYDANIPEEEQYPCTCGAQQAGIAYLQGKFEQRNRVEGKQVYPHVTCATDTENVSHVFNACKDIILKGNLESSGFM